MNRTGSNSTLARAAKVASATPAEREAARQDYIAYAKANRAINATPEPFERYLAEWLDCRRVRLDAGEEPSQYEKRDYSILYKTGDRW